MAVIEYTIILRLKKYLYNTGFLIRVLLYTSMGMRKIVLSEKGQARVKKDKKNSEVFSTAVLALFL